MNVLYNTNIVDPWVQVAKKLKEENNYEPVYWIGFNYDDSDTIVPKTFPDIVFQSYDDAWRGIFNEKISHRATETYLDVDLLNSLSRFELQALSMMDRLDYDSRSFNNMERIRHYHNLIKSWLAAISLYKIDLVISSDNPHRVYDYVLYLLCKKNGIPFIIFQNSLSIERIYAVDNCYTIGDKFNSNIEKYVNTQISLDTLPFDIKREFLKVQKDYKEAAPHYMKRHNKDNKQLSNPLSTIIKRTTQLKPYLRKGLVSVEGVKLIMIKNRKSRLENQKFSYYELLRILVVKRILVNKYKKLYNSLTQEPRKNEKYIFFPLHYQPEATTSPCGDIFANQMIAIETILKNTSEDIYVYVKEHPQQFQYHMEGQCSRIQDMYMYLSKCKRIRFMPLHMNSFEIMTNAIAVATITGTVGWEAIMHKKPVIVFGLIWYEQCPGVLRITDSESASKINNHIDSFKYNESNILSYLHAFANNSIIAYHYKGRKKYHTINENECVSNITNEVLKFSEK